MLPSASGDLDRKVETSWESHDDVSAKRMPSGIWAGWVPPPTDTRAESFAR